MVDLRQAAHLHDLRVRGKAPGTEQLQRPLLEVADVDLHLFLTGFKITDALDEVVHGMTPPR